MTGTVNMPVPRSRRWCSHKETAPSHVCQIRLRYDVQIAIQPVKIAPHMEQSFYWARIEHVKDLCVQLDQLELPLDALIEKVRGIVEDEDVRRLTDLASLLGTAAA